MMHGRCRHCVNGWGNSIASSNLAMVLRVIRQSAKRCWARLCGRDIPSNIKCRGDSSASPVLEGAEVTLFMLGFSLSLESAGEKGAKSPAFHLTPESCQGRGIDGTSPNYAGFDVVCLLPITNFTLVCRFFFSIGLRAGPNMARIIRHEWNARPS